MSDSQGLIENFRRHAVARLTELGAKVVTGGRGAPPPGVVFLVEETAETAVGRVRIWYGDREREVGSSIQPTGRPWPLDVVHYLSAMGEDPTQVWDSMWVDSESRLRAVLDAHADALRACLRGLAEDPDRLWARAEDERQDALAQGREQLRRAEMRRAIAAAADAFRAGGYGEVVRLLSPHAERLTPAQAKKLEIAIARVGSLDA